MFTLEREFGITGYAFWFKLLEVLGNTEGHFVDIEDRRTMKFLQAQTFTDSETCLKILDALADLDAIDPKLWKQRIIWSQNFVNGLAALYRNRNKTLPVRPDNYRQETGSSGIITGSNPRRKEGSREREEVERKEGDAPPPPNGSGGALVPVTPPAFSCPHFDIEAEYFQQLLADYPGLGNGRLLAEIKKAADYCTDNPKKHKRTSKGKLANFRLYLRNWMERATVPGQRGQPMSKAEQVTAANLRAAQEVMKKYE